jgi:predicted unusual protein kinase regulating ubiquinone biosynthesis (AarF/ABC1/UbiB family)
MPLTTDRALRRVQRSRLIRFVDLGLVLARLFLGYKLIGLQERWRGGAWAEEQRNLHHGRSAKRLYDAAVRNQGLMIKTAQFLSSRPDVVPDEYVEVLSRLQDEVPPEPFEVIRAVVEGELGKPIEAVFTEFEREPVASASLAQVHRAVLLDGRVAAVKVQYPGIAVLVAGDLRNNAFFIRLLNRIDKRVDLSFIAEEMGRQIPLELDFVREGHNAEAIAANFEGVEDIVVPEIYWEHTTKRVLVMQFVDGVKITDRAGIERLGMDTADVAKVLVVAFSEMLLQHGLFHADPHPGNLFVAPGPEGAQGRAPVLVLLDFGQVKEVGPQFRLIFGQMTRALLAADRTTLGQTFRNIGFRMKQDTAEGYEGLGQAYVGDIATEMLDREAGWADPDMFQASYRDILRLLRSNPLIKIPPDLLFVGRVMGLLNGLSMTLRSRTNMMVEMARLLDAADAEKANGNGDASKPERRRLIEA